MARGLSSHLPPAPHHRPHCKLGPQGHSLRAGGALSSRGARQRRGRGRVSVQSLSHLPLSKELSALPTVRTTLNRWVNVTTSMGSERTETRGTMATRRNGGRCVGGNANPRPDTITPYDAAFHRRLRLRCLQNINGVLKNVWKLLGFLNPSLS